VLLVGHASEPTLSRLQAVKGGVEVLLTTVVVFALIRGSRYPLERSNRRLKRREQKLQVLHRVLRHNLRNDLNVITAVARSLRDGTASERAADCDRILRSADEILHYTHQANRIRRVTEGIDGAPTTDGETTYDLSERIPGLVEAVERRTGSAEVSVRVPEGVTVDVNYMFDAAVEEVVTNAVERNDDETPRVVISVIRDDHGMTEIRVEDDSPGSRHTSPGYSPVQHDQVDHLEGMGLWFVYWTVVESGGELDIEESDLDGSRVRLRVPRSTNVCDRV
jgi:signal transduction histidine kinase